MASAAGISALLGITEPALFGVNLKLRYPFIGAITGSAIGSAYISFFKVKAIALGTAGLPGFISINPAHAGWLHYFIGMFIAFIIAVIVTLVLSRRKAYKVQQNKSNPCDTLQGLLLLKFCLRHKKILTIVTNIKEIPTITSHET